MRQVTCHALSAPSSTESCTPECQESRELGFELVLLNKIAELSKAKAKKFRGADLDATGLAERALDVGALNFLQVVFEIEA